MPDRMREAAEIIADGARRRAAWSSRIPSSIRVTSDETSAVISSDVPYAITFEAPDAPYWKHPVWGHGPRDRWHWATQMPRRFMLPAAEDDSDRAALQYAKTVDDMAHEAGFIGEG